MASRFQSLDGQLKEITGSVNSQIQSSISSINVYAKQIAAFNDAIEKAQGNADGKASNDLLDQRDLAVTELSKEIKTTIVQQGNSYNVFIGNGQPLVVSTKAFSLVPTVSPTDPGRAGVGYSSNGEIITLPESSLPGGKLGGLLEFRANSLDPALNSLGRVAVGLAMTFNAQHKLGTDLSGSLGGDFFVAADPRIDPSGANDAASDEITARIVDPDALTTSDYRVRVDSATTFVVTRLSNNESLGGGTLGDIVEIEGVEIDTAGTYSVGDEFVVRPTINGATDFRVAITDIARIAAAAPVRTTAPVANKGSGKITPADVNSTVLLRSSQLTLTVPAGGGTLTGFPTDVPFSVTSGGTTTTYPAGTTGPVPYVAGDTLTIDGVDLSVPTAVGAHTIARPTATLTFSGGDLTGFPAGLDLEVTHSDGSVTSYASVTAATAVAYQTGDTFTFGGISFSITGAPADTDTFVIGANTNGVGDGRNAVALGALQSANTLGNGTASYQGAYAQLVSAVGNKTRELQVTNQAETKYLEQAVAAQQAESGVNLDEEATNLLRYQQAYQAAGKVMQTASQLFELLLSLGT